MKNEYGTILDSNGYAPSIMRGPKTLCAICYRGGDLARHEIFHGAYRSNSKRFGLWLNLCPECHRAIHSEAYKDRLLKMDGQKMAMEYYGWSVQEFRRRFGKNYLEE